MKMIPAAQADILNYAPYSRNCQPSNCKRPYVAPVPSLNDVQLFVNFGASKPLAMSYDISVIDLCHPNQSTPATSTVFLIANNGDYWYGLFKALTTTANYSSFIIALKTNDQTFFSEQYKIETDCETLTKLSVCYPYNYNSEDANGIYIGQPDMDQPFSGNPDLFYHHNFWTRQGEVIETANKINFVANPKRAFASTLSKIFEFRPELVPGWYKDYLLSVYFRGNITINGTPAVVTDLAFEDVDVDYWKAYAVLGKEIKGGFGCGPFVCVDDLTCYPAGFSVPTFEDAYIGRAYNKVVDITGTATFTLSDVAKPDWMTVTLTGHTLTFGGTPLSEDLGTGAISFKISNACGDQEFTGPIEITYFPCVAVTFGSIAIDEEAHTDVPYNSYIQLLGDAPFALKAGAVKPDWMTITVTGNYVYLTGTPTEDATGVEVSFTITNCEGAHEQPYSTTIDVIASCEDYLNDNLGRAAVVTWTDCDGTFHNQEEVGENDSICIQPGSGSGSDFFYLRYLGKCY